MRKGESAFQALIPKLKDQDPNPGVVTSVMHTIGDLAQVNIHIFISNRMPSERWFAESHHSNFVLIILCFNFMQITLVNDTRFCLSLISNIFQEFMVFKTGQWL